MLFAGLVWEESMRGVSSYVMRKTPGYFAAMAGGMSAEETVVLTVMMVSGPAA
jgi:hypothetical protein